LLFLAPDRFLSPCEARICLAFVRLADAVKERLLKLLFSFVFGLFASVGLAQFTGSTVSKCLPAIYKITEPQQESSVELEMETSPAILSLFTTPSGRLSDFLRDSPVPTELEWRFFDKTKEEIGKLFWSELTYSEKMSLLQEISRGKNTPFFRDRKIPIVTYSDEVPVRLSKPTQFLGDELSRGETILRPKQFLKGAIEYMGPKNDPHGVELHFRTQHSAGQVSKSARAFQEILGVPVTHQHVYVVTPIPQRSLEASPAVSALQHTDFFRRVNLAAEMISIVENHQSITQNKSIIDGHEVRFFSWLETEKLLEVARYLELRGKNKDYALGDSIKMGWVGFRGHDKFDKPDLMGMEVRSISRDSDMEDMERFLNTIQKTWESQELGIPKERIERWLNQKNRGVMDLALTDSWYHQEWIDLLKKADPTVTNEFSLWTPEQRSRFITNLPEETKMLVHNWAADPLFMDAPEKSKLIAEEQAWALSRLKSGLANPNDIVRSFLLRSRLYESVLSSLVSETSLQSRR